jgi:hypothetical protein
MKTSVTLVNVLGLYTNLHTWKTSVTPVDVPKLYLSTNMEDLSDTGTPVHILVSLGFSMFVEKNNFSTSTDVTEVFHVCR